MKSFDKNQAEFYYGIGKDYIVKEGIFERFPELRPAVGSHYWREDGAHKKMLLVGESNYFDNNDLPFSDFLDAEKWYKTENAKLIPDNAREKISNWKGGRPFENAFKIMNKVLFDEGIEHDGQYLLNEAAFYNYFLRPAYNDREHRGFIPQDIDREVSGVALSGIIDKLNPELIIFLSKLASDEFTRFCKRSKLSYYGIIIEHVSHPSSPWWNRDGGCWGKMKFEELLKKFWV